MENLSWKHIDDLPRDKTIFFLPISPLEEHGPHLPVGTDLLASKDTASKAIQILQKKKPELNFVLMPSIPVGYCKFASDFPGTVSVSSRVVKDIVYSNAEALAQHGFKYMVICTYHLAFVHLKGIYKAMKKIRSKYGMNICEPWSPFYYGGYIKKNEPKLGFDTEKEIHAGFRETSMMRYQYPYLVDDSYKNLQSIYKSLRSPQAIWKTIKEMGLKDGYAGSPSRADVDYGRWYFTQTVEVYVKAALDLYEGKPTLDLPKSVKNIMRLLFWQ